MQEFISLNIKNFMVIFMTQIMVFFSQMYTNL